MANYQQLLSKAVGALPESNGASRREVYEKARKALVTQLRAIAPPLPAREITKHRLELEDCIRQVELEATETLLSNLKDMEDTSIPLVQEPEPKEPESQKPEVQKPEVQEASPKEPGVQEASPKEPGVQEASPKESEVQEVIPEQQIEEEDGDISLDSDAELSADNGPMSATDEGMDRLSAALAQANIEAEAAEKNGNGDEFKLDDADSDDADSNIDNVFGSENNAPVSHTALDVEENTSDKEDSPVNGGGNPALDAIIARAEQTKQNAAGTFSELKNRNETEDRGYSNNEELIETLENQASPSQSNRGMGAAMSSVSGTRSSNPVSSPTVARINAPDPAKIKKPEKVSGDAQQVIDRAIETLDREARTKNPEDYSPEDENLDNEENGFAQDDGSNGDGISLDETKFDSVDDDERGGNGLTIFLVLVVLLLGAVGGGGYYAWREGYIDLEALFASGQNDGQEQAGAQTGGQQTPNVGNVNPVRIIANGSQNPVDQNPAVGNTATQVETGNVSDANVVLEDSNKTENRLAGDNIAVQDSANEPDNSTVKVEDRLGESTEAPDTALGQAGDANAVAAGSSAQSLLLEAAVAGASGAVPFSGTVEWSRGVDELGEPTIIGQANIPARNLGVKILIRRNGDRSLPASHLMEIDFDVSSSFAGGSVAGLPGILLKNEELVQGAALVGASARIVGNSFLFALSAAEADVRTNLDLLQNRKWMDLALIYSSGRRAIITLQKDEAAQTLFNEIMSVWAQSDAAAAAAAAAAANNG